MKCRPTEKSVQTEAAGWRIPEGYLPPKKGKMRTSRFE